MTMDNIELIPLENLIRPEGFACSCGRRHKAPVPYLKIGSSAAWMVPDALRALSCRRPMVVCDENGCAVAGKDVCEALKKSGIDYSALVLSGEDGGRVKPSEQAAGTLLLRFENGCDAILGVGSGVINDLCKVLGGATGRPCLIVATAPSMDGYASDGASVEIGNVKRSLKEKMPAAILCDTGVLAEAPMRMIHAGLGDVFAKYTALCDWKVSHIVTGEYYCDAIAGLVRRSLKETVDAARGIVQREERAVHAVAEGLVTSGIAMAFAGNSHPASGLEHYFSHCWEMMALERGREPELHGVQVCVGMLLTLRLVETLRTMRPDMARAEAAADRFDAAAWEANLRRVFPKAADQLIRLEQRTGKNGRTGRLARAERIVGAWNEILKAFDELPERTELKRLLAEIGAPTTPRDIGLTADDVVDAFVCSRDTRDKYLLSSLMWDVGCMDELAERLRGWCGE